MPVFLINVHNQGKTRGTPWRVRFEENGLEIEARCLLIQVPTSTFEKNEEYWIRAEGYLNPVGGGFYAIEETKKAQPSLQPEFKDPLGPTPGLALVPDEG